MTKRIERVKRIFTFFLVFAIGGFFLVKAPSRAGQRELQVALRQLEQVTGLNFKRDVTLQRQSQDEFQKFLRGEMKKTFPGNDLRYLGQIYNLIGFLPMSYRLEEQLPELYKDQVGAYYDPEQEKIFQVSDELPEASQFFLYLHEGVHALQDQHFDLGDKQARLARGTTLDQQLAFGFVVEGHANLVATAAQMNVSALNPDFFTSKRFGYVFDLQSRLTNLSPGQFNAITKLFGGENTPTARSLSKLGDVPLILVQQMADPYLVGQNVLFKRSRRLGFERTLDWLRTIPNSTGELLFDEHHGEEQEAFTKPSGVYETSMGHYLIMRWLNVFDRRPPWIGKIKRDRIALLGDDTDRAVAWRLEFSSDQAQVSFEDELSRLLSDGEPKSGDRSGTVFGRNNQSRYFWYKPSPEGLTLFFDDDDDIEPELTHHGYSLDKLSGRVPVSTVEP